MADAGDCADRRCRRVAAETAPPGPLREFWLAYSQSRGALIGLALVLLLIVLALCADVVAPHPPNEQYREFTLTPPAWARRRQRAVHPRHRPGGPRHPVAADPRHAAVAR